MRWAVAVVALALLACSANQQPAGSHGMATPLTVDASAPGGAEVVDAGGDKTLSIERFTPLLALPVLSEAAAAVERGATGVAARKVEAVLDLARLPAEREGQDRRSLERKRGRFAVQRQADLDLRRVRPAAGEDVHLDQRVLLAHEPEVRVVRREDMRLREIDRVNGDVGLVGRVHCRRYHGTSPSLTALR